MRGPGKENSRQIRALHGVSHPGPELGRPPRRAPDATSAEVLSKTLFIWGPARGLELVEKLPDVEAVIVDADNQLHVSSGLKDRLILLSKPSEGI